ncbi:MAG: NAD(P)/FAD-dependent oxidoreductase [Chloroflexota bacterium]|nr:NAD(P)/FAD-dependent oxidoreductase [Chloroflexota bacterium]
MTIEVDITIIGAGVVGLAIASELAEQGRSVFVFERNRTFGQETSSRNSEVIHAGIYYPEDSLKAKLCVEGNRLLYEICEKHSISYRKSGKMIVAVTQEEITKLEKIFEQAAKNGVTDLELLSQSDIKQLEPNIRGRAGVLSPSTGIIDTHSLMLLFHQKAVEYGAEFLFETTVAGMDKTGDAWKVSVHDWEGISDLTSQVVINCAGLSSDVIARLAGIDREHYRLHYCKGDYFSLSSRWRNSITRLVYPTPEQTGLGVHATLALDGMIRLGPDAHYVDEIDYEVNKTQKNTFYRSSKQFLPALELDDLNPDFAGIRPKLQGPSELFRDFVITHENRSGFQGFLNLIGIESPGLTASPAIARYVAELVSEILD